MDFYPDTAVSVPSRFTPTLLTTVFVMTFAACRSLVNELHRQRNRPGVRSMLVIMKDTGLSAIVFLVLIHCHPASWGRYHGGRPPSSHDSCRNPTVIAPSALDQPSIMKRYHPWRTCSHTSPRRSSTMVTLHDTRFVECRWWNDGWTVKTVVT